MNTNEHYSWVQYISLDRGALTPSPCEQHMHTDINSHADETVMESYANRKNSNHDKMAGLTRGSVLGILLDGGWKHTLTLEGSHPLKYLVPAGQSLESLELSRQACNKANEQTYPSPYW